MHPRRARKNLHVVVLLAAISVLGCTASTGSEVAGAVGGKADDPACEGATLDGAGICRLPSGRFAARVCCERELLADCISETEECLGHIEDLSYAESCGVNYSAEFCVSETHCPDWVFSDPERTAHEILGVDTSTQCAYVCEEWYPDCMYDHGSGEDDDYATAVEACIAHSGCPADLCETSPALCDSARETFDEARASRPEPMEPTEPTPPAMWTLERCAAEAEECLGHTEDETFFDACGDTLDGTVCINEESCPPEVFSDPERTPLEVLDIDISEQCSYVCSTYLPDCMYDAGYDDSVSLADAFATCIDDTGCRSDVCDTDRALCDEAAERFASAREP